MTLDWLRRDTYKQIILQNNSFQFSFNKIENYQRLLLAAGKVAMDDQELELQHKVWEIREIKEMIVVVYYSLQYYVAIISMCGQALIVVLHWKSEMQRLTLIDWKVSQEWADRKNKMLFS